MQFPTELVVDILANLPLSRQFILATSFRFLFLQKNVISSLPALSIDSASSTNKLSLLDYWKLNFEELPYSHNAIMSASEFGHVDTLQWWLDSGLPLKYDPIEIAVAIDRASEKGLTQVLQWWKTSGLKFTWSHIAMDEASKNAKIDTLQWWVDSGLEMRWSENALEYIGYGSERITQEQHLAVIKWWKDRKVEMRYRVEFWEKILEKEEIEGGQVYGLFELIRNLMRWIVQR